MKKKMLLLALATILSVTLWGCGSSRDTASVTGGDSEDSLAAAETVGVNNCLKCHNSNSAEVADWLAGAHGTALNVMNNGIPAFGVPAYYPYDADHEECAQCHNALGDGDQLPQADVNLTDRAIISCETCHGGGQFHNGIASGIPYAKPGLDRCAQCHNAEVDHHTYHPEADSIGEKVAASPHYAGEGFAHVQGDDGTVRARCAKCHTDEGAREYKNVPSTLAYADLKAAFETEANVADTSPIQCRTCHEGHALHSLLDVDENVTGSAEYNLCTNCHQVADSYHGESSSYSFDDDGNFESDRIIYDTHFDNPATAVIEGYNLGPIDGDANSGVASERVCRDCHDVHAADNTINDQWARSGHGGEIAAVKAAADATVAQNVINAAVDDTTGAAWAHYDWDATTEYDATDGVVNDRASCQMCHTSTGAMNYLNDPAAYDPINNDFSHLDGWSLDGGANGETVSSGQNELLYCWGCHSNNSGDLRNPGAITRPYTSGGVDVALADVGSSNVCINCHGARGNTESYELGAADDPLTGNPATDMSAYLPGFSGNTANVTAAHYLTAAATLFAADTKIGYEYPVVIVDGDGNPVAPYAAKSYFAHDSLGLNADSPETGIGPCVACHMQTEESHTFEVVEKDDSGVITALLSTACIECHTGGHGAGLVVEDTTTENGLQTAAAAAAFLEEEAEGFHEALEILNQELIADGLTFSTSYPYFSGTSWIDEGTFGAAHNYNYLHHEPGAYAHNRYYAKRLIFDSIDWLDNGVLNGVINIDATTYPEAAHWLGAADTADATATPPVVVGDASRP
jgi:hypothetical protein